MIAEAKTPADHEAIAAFYEKEVQGAREKQVNHEKMRDSYAKITPLKQKTSVVAHCEAIAKKYQEMAEEYEDLARLHKEMATEAQ
jgi:hypothetical protein